MRRVTTESKQKHARSSEVVQSLFRKIAQSVEFKGRDVEDVFVVVLLRNVNQHAAFMAFIP